MNEAGEIENFRRATRKGLNPHSLDNLVHEGTMHSYYPVLDGNDKCSLTISHFCTTLRNARSYVTEDMLDGFSAMWWSACVLRCGWNQTEKSTTLTTGVKEFFGERVAIYFWFLGNENGLL